MLRSLTVAALAGLGLMASAANAYEIDPLTRQPLIQYADPAKAQATTIPREIVSYQTRHPVGTIVVDTAERRLYLLTTTRWLPVGFVVGIFVLVMTGRGLSIAEAATVGSVLGITCFVLELPTSGFADAVGRRRGRP